MYGCIVQFISVLSGGGDVDFYIIFCWCRSLEDSQKKLHKYDRLDIGVKIVSGRFNLLVQQSSQAFAVKYYSQNLFLHHKHSKRSKPSKG